MAQSDYRIGIVGVGRMGANMARRLHDLHIQIVAVYDTDTETRGGTGQGTCSASHPDSGAPGWTRQYGD